VWCAVSRAGQDAAPAVEGEDAGDQVDRIVPSGSRSAGVLASDWVARIWLPGVLDALVMSDAAQQLREAPQVGSWLALESFGLVVVDALDGLAIAMQEVARLVDARSGRRRCPACCARMRAARGPAVAVAVQELTGGSRLPAVWSVHGEAGTARLRDLASSRDRARRHWERGRVIRAGGL
jgi:hypothetical protein